MIGAIRQLRLLGLMALTNNVILRYPATDGKPQQFTINLETDLPYRFSLPPGKHQLEIAEESFTIEVQSAGDKPDWIFPKAWVVMDYLLKPVAVRTTIPLVLAPA